MEDSFFLKGRICLNVLAKDVENAKEIYEATEGHVLIGILSNQFATVDEAIESIKSYDRATNSHISIGLGGGDPNQSEMVAEICKYYQAKHVNQVFSKIGYTKATVNNNETWINGLVRPTGVPGYVNVAMDPTNDTPVQLKIVEAIRLIREMGGNAIKFFPLNGLETLEEYQAVAKACAKENFALEPTGGIDLDNFKTILEIALDAGVKQIIPHVYSSIIDKLTGKTKLENIYSLYAIMQKVGETYVL